MNKFINHLTKKEEKFIVENLSNHYEINILLISLKSGSYPRYFIVTGKVISIPDYYVVYEITKYQFDNNFKIHDILI